MRLLRQFVVSNLPVSSLPLVYLCFCAQNGAVSAVSQFNCGQQNRSLPEGLRQYKVIPQLVSVHGAARPSGFYLSSGTTNNVLGVQPSTGQLFVLNSSALDYEAVNNYTLIVSGRQRSFDSGCVWCHGHLFAPGPATPHPFHLVQEATTAMCGLVG